MSEHPQARPATDVEWFQANGRGTGILILLLWVVIAGFSVAYGAGLALVAGLLVAAVLTYVTLLRPAVGTTSDDLVYRQMFSDLRIPLASIDEMAVTRYFQVTVAGKRYISPAVARSRRGARRSAFDARLGRLGGEPTRAARVNYAELVEELTRTRIADAKRRLGGGGTTAKIRRTWARTEIVAGVVAVVFLIVCLAV